MIKLTKKHAVSAILLAFTAIFLYAEEKTFNIPGKGDLTRDVQLVRVEDYDKKGRITSDEPSVAPATLYYYDKKGQLVKSVMGYNYYVTEFEYDKKGNLIHTSDTDGHEIWYTYDKKGKLIEDKTSTGLVGHYTYDENGNLSKYQVDDPEGDAVISCEWYYYDEKNRMIHKEPSIGEAVDYTYDKNGNLIKESYSNGTTVDYAYSESGDMLYKCLRTYDVEHEEFYEYEWWSKGKIRKRRTYLWEVYG